VNCATVSCPALACPSPGSHVEIPAGQCCPVCVPGYSQACNTAEANYSRDRQQYIQKYNSVPCNHDSDCLLVSEANSCVSNCGTALPVLTAMSFLGNISSDAMACNAACPPTPPPPCVQQVAVCSNGTCTTVPATGGGGGPAACMQAVAAYDMQRAALIQKFTSTPCNVNTDCTLVVERNGCVASCGQALLASFATDYSNDLGPAAAACNASCPLTPPPPCPAITATCLNGQCVAGPSLGLQ
jgi:hypothetical protein